MITMTKVACKQVAYGTYPGYNLSLACENGSICKCFTALIEVYVVFLEETKPKFSVSADDRQILKINTSTYS